MYRRKVLEELIEISDFSPVIGLLGPRQVGKTTLVKEFANSIEKDCIYLDLEKPSDFQKLQEAELYFEVNRDKCILLDEIQIRPDLFPIIRSMVDEHRVPLRFIILGSASPEIMRDSSQSLAGRISYIDLSPFSISELPGQDLHIHHFLGGFPNSILTKKNKQSLRWIDDFIKTYIQRDLPLLGLSASPEVVRRLWEMLAWQSGGTFNATAIGNSLGLTNHTINRYIDFLEGTFMINRLSPFSFNMKKRIVKSPKLYISDTGILHGLMRIDTFDQLMGMPMLGASFESYVLNQVIAEKPKDLEVYFYRTHAGTEIDLVLTRGMKPVACVEVKYTSTPKMTKSLHNGIADLGTDKNFIVTPTTDTFPVQKNILAIGVKEFILQTLPLL